MKRITTALSLLACMSPVALSAQATWDAPSFMHAGAPSGLTLALIDSDPGDGLGVLGIWRRTEAPIGVGFRAGISEAGNNHTVGIFGFDLSGLLPGLTQDSEAQALWWTGAGVGVGNHFSASFPLGMVFSWNGMNEGVSFVPYGGGHIVLDLVTHGNDDLRLNGVVDLGLDVTFPSGWAGRFSAALGDRDALGIGVLIPTR